MFKSETSARPATTAGAGTNDLLSRNAMTTAGVLIGAGTGVAGAAVLVAALPAQTITAGVVTGAFLYAGDRQHKGLSINPFDGDKSDDKSDETAQASA